MPILQFNFNGKNMKIARIVVLVLFLVQCAISPIDTMDSRTLSGALYRLFPFLLPKKSSTPPSVIATNAIVGEEKFAINRKVYAIFNKEVKLSSDSALEIFSGEAKISGKGSVEKNTIKFTPDSLLPKDVKLTATIYKNGVVDSDSNSMESDFSFSFETGSQSDLTPPLISSISPLKGASSVGTNTEMAIEFSEAMETSTLTSENIELYEGTEKIPVTISYAGNIVLLKSSRTLAASSNYVINVKKVVQDSAGNSMSADFTSTFSTGGGLDSTSPMVSAVFPGNGATDIPLTQKGIILIFSEVLDPLSITKNSIQIQNSKSEIVNGSFSRYSNTIVFYPTSDLKNALVYTIKVNKEIKDLAGNSLEQDSTSTFSTTSYLSSSSTPPPTFTMSSVSSNLTNGQTGINPSGNITLNFPEAIDPSSLNGSNITLVDSAGNVITGTFALTNNNLSVVFDPSVELSPNTTYTISVLAGIETLSGRRLSSNFTLSFTTGAVSVAQYTIGGTVSGLVGSVTLQNNSTDTLILTANGNFTFANALNSGSSYLVSVSTQPSGQVCSVSNGSGTLTSNIPNVAVTCVNNTVTSPPSALTYAGSPYTFTQNTTITTITPTAIGTVTSCVSNPALPTGLSLNATTCAISGTPTVTQTATNHTITASNAFGNTTAVVNITVTDIRQFSEIQSILQAQAALGSSGTEVAATITGFGGGLKWGGGVLAPNGKIYGIPRDSSRVLIIDPITDTADTTTITVTAGSDKWGGGVLAPNGKIYGIPFGSTSVLIIDPTTNTADTTTITGLGGGLKWNRGVLAPNGKIYCIPSDSTSVLIIDPTNNTADTTTITGLAGSDKWIGGVLAPNGKIYGMPYDSTSVLIIDPTTNTATTAMAGLSGGKKWSGGVLAPNGKIYGIPHNSTNVLIIDPVTNTADTTTLTGLGTGFKWTGGILSPNGKIYGMPNNSTSVLIIDPSNNTADTTTIIGLGTEDFKWAGGILSPNGKIYGIPRSATSVLIIDPKSIGTWPADLYLSPYFNKY